MDIYEVTMTLIGQVEPVGETHTDNKTYENLRQLTNLAEQLLTDICRIEHQYKNNHQHSMKRASTHCSDFLDANNIRE